MKAIRSLFIYKGETELRLRWALDLFICPPDIRGGELTQRLLNNYDRIQNIVNDNKKSNIKIEETIRHLIKTRYEVFSEILKENDRFPPYFNMN